MGDLTRVAAREEVQPGSPICVDFNGEKVAVFNVDGNYFAIGDTCTHHGAPLSTGDVEAGEVVCPWHGARFSLETGEAMCPPAPGGVACYKVVIEGEDLKLGLP